MWIVPALASAHSHTRKRQPGTWPVTGPDAASPAVKHKLAHQWCQYSDLYHRDDREVDLASNPPKTEAVDSERGVSLRQTQYHSTGPISKLTLWVLREFRNETGRSIDITRQNPPYCIIKSLL